MEALYEEMETLRRQGNEQCVEFELKMTDLHLARALLVHFDKHGWDVDKLNEALTWLFEGGR